MNRLCVSLSVIAVAGLVASCGEAPPMRSTQFGFRGTAVGSVTNPRIAASLVALNGIPATPYALDPDNGGERAGHAYQNVKVLGDLSTDQFNHLMASITQWVAPPAQGCNYCHNPNNMASDAVYTKVVARRMLQMTRNINANWTSHVRGVGVTCWTCHRGNAVPMNVWNEDPSSVPKSGQRLIGNTRGIASAGHDSVKYASLPYDPFTPYLLGAYPIRVQSTVAVNGPEVPIKATEATYGLMMHMSGSLGVNCTYCHNSRSWSDWSQSRPQRVTAWYGIRMVRNINNDYIQKLAWAMPANRKGPLGDPYKVNCTTCHQGLPLPLYGVSMRKEHPQLWGPVTRDVGGIALPGVPAAAVPQADGSVWHVVSAKAVSPASEASALRSSTAVASLATPTG